MVLELVLVNERERACVLLAFASHRGLLFVTNIFLAPGSSFPTLLQIVQKQREVHSAEVRKQENTTLWIQQKTHKLRFPMLGGLTNGLLGK